jgi:hypothetical protein
MPVPTGRRFVKKRGVATQMKASMALQKTTKKGAYNKQRKKEFGKRRRPFVETKTREAITVNLHNSYGGEFDPNYPNVLEFANLPVDDAFTLLEPRSFTRMCQGIGEDKMIGESVYSRYVKQKVTFKYPGGAQQIAHAHNMYLISGWITTPMGLSDTEGNQWNGSDIPSISQIDFNSLKSYIAYQVKQYYNEREDKMRFIPKETTSIKVESYRKIRANRTEITGLLPNDGGALSETASGGEIPHIHMSNTWTVNRKVHYSKGKAISAVPQQATNDTENWFPNHAWLPFTVIYNPDFENQKDIAGNPAVIQLCYNDQHWYTDA